MFAMVNVVSAAVQVFAVVLRHGPISRVEVTARTGLSPAAVTKAVRPLVDAGYLTERPDERTPSRLGRPAMPVQVVADRAFFIGVKLTADEVIAVRTDLCGVTRDVVHRPLASTAVGDVVEIVAEVVRGLAADHEVACLGVSLAGDVLRDTGMVRFSPFLNWRNVPLADLVSAATGLPTLIENDVRALTVAEHWFGAGVGVSSFALVTAGTGIGCGLVVNDVLLPAGELGHVAIDVDGPECYCGGRGCVEALAADRVVLAGCSAVVGRPLTMPEAIELGRGGDAAVHAVFERAGRALGLALAAVANLVGPERIVLTGEAVGGYDLYAEQIRQALAAQAFGAAATCELVVRPLPFDEWARGAAVVGIQDLITRSGAARGSTGAVTLPAR
jgi:predicted NBD/HSP70 family sugar kinase